MHYDRKDNLRPLPHFHQYFAHDVLMIVKRTFWRCLRYANLRSPINDDFYRAFHRFGQAKIAHGGLVLGSSQFSLLHQKMMLASKVVKID